MMSQVLQEPLKVKWSKLKRPNAADLEQALSYAVEKVRSNLIPYRDRFLSAAGKNNNYTPTDNVGWTTGFWSGMVWTAFALTGDDDFLKVGKIHSQSFRARLEQDKDMHHHDIGFLFSLSCVADYKMTKDQVARETAVKAANRLAQLFRPIPGIIQRGGNMSNLADPFTGVFIVDCLMNIPLWFWVAEETGDASFREMAHKHAKNSILAMVQPHGAVIQHGIADVISGTLRADADASQGKGGLDACWSRGQAWAIYGLALAYAYTKDRELLEVAKSLACYYLNRLPDDFIANWDLYYTGNDEQRDTSAAAIVACGLLELAGHLPNDDALRDEFESAALAMLDSLIHRYVTTKDEDSNALLKAGVYAYRINNGINEPCVWGDYFFMEALWRVQRPFVRFW